MTGPIILIVFIIAIAGLCIWFYIKNKPTDSQSQPEVVPTPEPIPEPEPVPEPDPEPTPEPNPEEPIEQDPTPEEPIENEDISGADSSDDTTQEETDPASQEEAAPQEKEKTLDDIVSEEASQLVHDLIVPTFSGVFGSISIDDPKFKTLWPWINELVEEAVAQSWPYLSSVHNLPSLYQEENFPEIYDWHGKKEDRENTTRELVAWVVALQLAEIVPEKRDDIFKAGYVVGGDKDTPIYDFEFYSDKNIARLVASSIYSAMRGKKMINDEAIAIMRAELGGHLYPKTLKTYSQDSFAKNQREFFVSLEKFMPTAPGPYLSGYSDRSSIGGAPYPEYAVGSGKTSDLNLEKDVEIYNYVTSNFNLDDKNPYWDRAVQAVADKDADLQHLFGKDREVGEYKFSPVFGEKSIGIEINPSGDVARLVKDTLTVGSMQRKSLMNGSYYGRRRPAQTKTDGVSKSGRDGILCNFVIENNDGNAGVYQKNGNWVTGKEITKGDFCEYSHKQVYANSYPSGHSSCIWSAAMTLIELMPERADLIMRAANNFAVNRTICRYHWNSDTLIGRMLSSTVNAVAHATPDFNERINKAREEVKLRDTSILV